MVFLPESCDFIGESKAETVASAEPLDGEMIQKFQQMARENGVWLSLGGILEKVGMLVDSLSPYCGFHK